MSDENHEFDFSKIGEWSDGLTFRAEREHMVALAAATNDDLEPHVKGEHIRIVRPIRAYDDLRCRAKVVGIHGRSSGVVVTTFVETSTAQGELVNEQYVTGFFRGGRLDGGKGETPPSTGSTRPCGTRPRRRAWCRASTRTRPSATPRRRAT